MTTEAGIRNVVIVAISVAILVGVGRASFAGDSSATSPAAAQAGTPVNRTSMPAAQNQASPVKPFHGGVVGGVTPPPSGAPSGCRLASAWTLDERLANRCDPLKARERTREGERASTELTAQFVARGLLPPRQSAGATSHADIISGRFHPELFLPHELFQDVVHGVAFDPGYRLVYGPKVEAAGLSPDFWSRLESLSAAYISDLHEQRNRLSDKSAAGRARAMARWVALDRQTCHDGSLALRAARATFGPALDHFMYEYVAPESTAFFDEISDERTLRSREAGCE